MAPPVIQTKHNSLRNIVDKHNLHPRGFEASSTDEMNSFIDTAWDGDTCWRSDLKIDYYFYSGVWNLPPGLSAKNVVITAVEYFALIGDGLILVDTTGGDVVIHLPLASLKADIKIVNIGTGGAVQIFTQGGDSWQDGAQNERDLKFKSAFLEAYGDGVDTYYITGLNFDNVNTLGNRTASGASSHTEGKDTVASGSYAHAEGDTCTASNSAAHAEGQSTVASGNRAHAEGLECTASGDQSHAGGAQTVASNNEAFAHGENCEASGQTAFAFGKQAHATHNYSWVISDSDGAVSDSDAQMKISLANGLKLNSSQTVTPGTSGDATSEQPLRGNVKKFIVYLNAFVSVAGVTLNFPTAFSQTPFIAGNTGVVAISVVSASQVVLTTAAPVTGYLILEGF